MLLRGSTNAWTTLQKHPPPPSPSTRPASLPPLSLSVCLSVGQPRPISRPRGIKPLGTVIAFADPVADPIGSWENDINWWSDPIRQEFWGCEQVTFVLWWSGSSTVKDFWVAAEGWGRGGVGGAELVCVRGSLPLGQRGAPGAVLVGEDVDNFLL